jgi:hypothetical protein
MNRRQQATVATPGRRFVLKALASGAGLAIAPLWQAIAASGDSAKAYPAELLSIDEYTGGRIRSGTDITASNVEFVRELLDPIRYQQVVKMGRRLKVAPSTTDVTRLSPVDYLEATLRNRGMARFDVRGNVVTAEGRPWIGGNPFPEPTSGVEYFAGLTLSWGRHDAALYCTSEFDLGPGGEVQFRYESGWAELATNGRLRLDPKPLWPGHENLLRYQSVFFVSPQEVRGTAFLNVWYYDQSTMPDLFGYLPAFKRIRRFPTDQRFEPLIPGSTLYLSDAWAAGDPLNTWGDYRIVSRGPFLAAVDGNWNSANAGWRHGVHGGPKGATFFDTTVELVPEAVVVEASPVAFPRAPVSRKRVWFDARTGLPVGMVSFDRRGEPFRSFDAAYSTYEAAGTSVRDGAQPYWSWTHVHVHDVQTGRLTRFEQVRNIVGHATSVNDSGIYEKYLTQQALMRLGGS